MKLTTALNIVPVTISLLSFAAARPLDNNVQSISPTAPGNEVSKIGDKSLDFNTEPHSHLGK